MTVAAGTSSGAYGDAVFRRSPTRCETRNDGGGRGSRRPAAGDRLRSVGPGARGRVATARVRVADRPRAHPAGRRRRAPVRAGPRERGNDARLRDRIPPLLVLRPVPLVLRRYCRIPLGLGRARRTSTTRRASREACRRRYVRHSGSTTARAGSPSPPGLFGMVTTGRTLSRVLSAASALAWNLPVVRKTSIKVIGAIAGLVTSVGIVSVIVNRIRDEWGVGASSVSLLGRARLLLRRVVHAVPAAPRGRRTIRASSFRAPPSSHSRSRSCNSSASSTFQTG